MSIFVVLVALFYQGRFLAKNGHSTAELVVLPAPAGAETP